MHNPGEPHQRLTFFAGQWEGQEYLAPSPWAEGGEARSHTSARLGLGGFYLQQHYQQERDGRISFCVQASIGYDDDKGYALFWLDSAGFVPHAPAWGRWVDAQTLVFRLSPRGQARHTYRLTGLNSYDMTIENSFDQGQSWSLFMRGSYKRLPSSE